MPLWAEVSFNLNRLVMDRFPGSASPVPAATLGRRRPGDGGPGVAANRSSAVVAKAKVRDQAASCRRMSITVGVLPARSRRPWMSASW